MPIPSYTSQDFLGAFLRALPSGRVWPKHSTSNLSIAASTMMGTYARSTEGGIAPTTVGDNASSRGSANRASDILMDSMPSWSALGAAAVVELLPDWQASLGLPDPCLGLDPTVNDQVRQAVARFIALDGMSIPFYVAFAANLGFTISIAEYSDFRTDVSRLDSDYVGDEVAPFLWRVDSLSHGSWLFETDVNAADEALGGGFDNTTLECEFRRLAPAHTVLFFAYDLIPITGVAAQGQVGTLRRG